MPWGSPAAALSMFATPVDTRTLRTLSSFRSIARAFGRPLRLLWAHRLLVLLGCVCIPDPRRRHAVDAAPLGDTLDLLQHGLEVGRTTAASTTLRNTCLLLLGLALAESLFRYVSRKTLIDVSRHVEEDSRTTSSPICSACPRRGLIGHARATS